MPLRLFLRSWNDKNIPQFSGFIYEQHSTVLDQAAEADMGEDVVRRLGFALLPQLPRYAAGGETRSSVQIHGVMDGEEEEIYWEGMAQQLEDEEGESQQLEEEEQRKPTAWSDGLDTVPDSEAVIQIRQNTHVCMVFWCTFGSELLVCCQVLLL